MTRIELGGGGTPTPQEALPDGLTGDTLTPLTFAFNADGSFDKTLWTPFGFSVFTVMCVGASGGRGSFAWYILGAGQMAPTMIVTSGGGGGGGGLHIVSGLLADLDDISDIIVGLRGAEGADAHPGYSPFPVSFNWHGIDVGVPGGDGGYSSFGGDVCMASGGKGGEVSPVVISPDPGTSWRPGGDGGAGGVGGSIVAGGGAAGGISEPDGGMSHWFGGDFPSYRFTPGEQGFWDGTIGEGGGGGVGFTGGGFGVGGDASFITDTRTDGFFIMSVRDEGPTESGRGSFSYADSSKHGAKQNNPDRLLSTHDWNQYSQWSWPVSFPGCGGGARPTPLAKYGSYAEGYSPDGVVIVRIT